MPDNLIYSTRTRVYPIPLKARSGIATWSQWPDDVRDEILRWNTQGRLSFYGDPFAFKCTSCQVFCEPQSLTCQFAPSGDKRNKRPFCDDCIIAIAREWIENEAIHADVAEASFRALAEDDG